MGSEEDPSHRTARLIESRQDLSPEDPLHARLLQLNQALEQKEGPSRIKTLSSTETLSIFMMLEDILYLQPLFQGYKNYSTYLLWLGADDRQPLEGQSLLQYAWNLIQTLDQRHHSLFNTFARSRDELFQVVNRGGSKRAIVSLINQ